LLKSNNIKSLSKFDKFAMQFNHLFQKQQTCDPYLFPLLPKSESLLLSTMSPVTIETDRSQQVQNRLRTGSELRTDSEIFKVGIGEKFSGIFPQVENILMLYIGSVFFGRTRHARDSARK
jgi:hypothetical protein